MDMVAKMRKRQARIDRMSSIREALEKANEYLATGKNAHWRGFRPWFGSDDRLPHPDWINNSYIPWLQRSLARCEKRLQTLEARASERRTNRRNRAANYH